MLGRRHPDRSGQRVRRLDPLRGAAVERVVVLDLGWQRRRLALRLVAVVRIGDRLAVVARNVGDELVVVS